MGLFLEVDDERFNAEVLQSGLPVVVEFGATWCQPCKHIEPLLEQLSKEDWHGKVRLVKVDVDESVNLTMRYQVMSVPTVILFSDGEQRERLVGSQPRKKLVDKFSPYL